MSVSPTDLLSPAGRLQGAVLWPGLSPAKVKAKLTGFLTDAAAQGLTFGTTADEDAWTKQWAYYRAYDEVLDVRINTPSSVSVDQEGSSSFLQQQIQWLIDRRDEAKAAADVLAEAETPVDEGGYDVIQSYR